MASVVRAGDNGFRAARLNESRIDRTAERSERERVDLDTTWKVPTEAARVRSKGRIRIMAESEGWTKEFPQVEGFYFIRECGRLEPEDAVRVIKAIDGFCAYRTMVDRVLFASDFRNYEFLSVSPSDAEQLIELRKLAQTSLDLLNDVYNSRASQRFSAIGLSRIQSHVKELSELLNPSHSQEKETR